MYELNKEWLKLEEELGHAKARLVAHAVSWAFRPDNWRFLSWYSYLKDNQQYVNKYFDYFLSLETREMSKTRKSDISHLISYFNLPLDTQVYKVDPNYKPTRDDIRQMKWQKINRAKREKFNRIRWAIKRRRS